MYEIKVYEINNNNKNLKNHKKFTDETLALRFIETLNITDNLLLEFSDNLMFNILLNANLKFKRLINLNENSNLLYNIH